MGDVALSSALLIEKVCSTGCVVGRMRSLACTGLCTVVIYMYERDIETDASDG